MSSDSSGARVASARRRSEANPPIAVVGAGVIGVAAALELQRAGFDVELVDADAPGLGCSFGNAGILATSFILPLASPAQLLSAPKMLLDPLGPLAIRWSDLGSTAPWILELMRNSLPGRRRRSIDQLKILNSQALQSWRVVAASIGAGHLLVERGMLEVSCSGSSLRSLRSATTALRREGVAIEDLDEDAVRSFESALTGPVAGGAFHRDVAHVADPHLLTQALLAAFRSAGGSFTKIEVERLEPSDGGVTLHAAGSSRTFGRAVVAAGTASARLLAPFGLRIPLQAEHGYHATLPTAASALSRPILFHDESFLATPMSCGLRLAGTVELAGPDAPPNLVRGERLIHLAERYLGSLDTTDRRLWRGMRPSLPDSLPAIGQLGEAPQIYYSFGHQHLGLTLAAVTANMIAALVAGKASPVPTAPFALDRFGSGLK
jgi:glycine/D-amino acid oxidase-like deaminating enzyme